MIRTQGDCKDIKHINIDALNKLHTYESCVHNSVFIEQYILFRLFILFDINFIV